MAHRFEKGKHIFFLFRNGFTVQDSQLKPRFYLTREKAEEYLPFGDEIVEYAPVITGLHIVSGDKLPPNPHGALTLSTEYIGKHENGWEIVADVHEDYYEWVNEFVAYKHNCCPPMFVAGDFEVAVVASSEKAYEEFLNIFHPEAWDYGDI